MKKIIPITLLLISCMHINAQAFEFGLGISPVHIEGNQVFTYEDNNGHTIHYLEPIQPVSLLLFNVNCGMYFNLLNGFDEFSAGVLYQSIFSIGKTSYGAAIMLTELTFLFLPVCVWDTPDLRIAEVLLEPGLAVVLCIL